MVAVGQRSLQFSSRPAMAAQLKIFPSAAPAIPLAVIAALPSLPPVVGEVGKGSAAWRRKTLRLLLQTCGWLATIKVCHPLADFLLVHALPSHDITSTWRNVVIGDGNIGMRE